MSIDVGTVLIAKHNKTFSNKKQTTQGKKYTILKKEPLGFIIEDDNGKDWLINTPFIEEFFYEANKVLIDFPGHFYTMFATTLREATEKNFITHYQKNQILQYLIEKQTT